MPPEDTIQKPTGQQPPTRVLRHLTHSRRRRAEQTLAIVGLERAFRRVRKALADAEAAELLDALRGQIGGTK